MDLTSGILWRAAALLLCILPGCAPSRGSADGTPRRAFVYVDEDAIRGAYGQRVRALLNTGRFDQLDAMSDSLEGRWPSGRPLIDSFYDRGFGEVDDKEKADAWQLHLRRLRQWTEARPESYAARYALAEGLIGRAWAARGEGWASTVSRSEFGRMESDLVEAGQRLRQMPAPAQDAYEWRMAMMQVLHGMGEDSLYRVLAFSTLRLHPDAPRLYSNIAIHLMPRWYGKPGEWEAFANDATAALPDSISDEFYARIVAGQSQYARNVFRESRGLSWPRTKRGLAAWRQRWPASTQPLSAAALLGWMAEDRDLARTSFESLRDTFDVEIWGWTEPYSEARKWAMQKGS
jgi:uncharacterized protein DUF4034